MQITLTVHVPRRRPHPVDVVVRWSGEQSAATLCRALADHLGVPVSGLSSRARTVPGSSLVGRPPLLHGAAVTVAHAVGTDGEDLGVGRDAAVLELAVVGGPDAGRSRLLLPPGAVVGRSAPQGLSLDDDALSRQHAEVRVDASGVVVSDCGSTNGVIVDGARRRGTTELDAGHTVVLGASTLRLRRRPGAGLPLRALGDGHLVVRPVPARDEVVEDVVVRAPVAPMHQPRPRIPWVAALLPVPVAGGLAFVLGPQLLLFALLGPLLVLGSALGDRVGAGRARRRALDAHAEATAEARAQLDARLREESARLDRAHPDPHEVLRCAEHRLPRLWSRDDLRVRLGLGRPATRVVWHDGETRHRPPAHHAPVVVDLVAGGGLVVVGAKERVASSLAGVVGQLSVACAPSAVRIALLTDDPHWQWVARLPHATAPPRSSGAARPAGVAAGSTDRADSARHVLVVPWPDSVLTDVVTTARSAGWVVLVGAPPGSADGRGILLDVAGDPGVTTAAGRVALVPDHVGPWWSDRVSRALAPLCCGPPEDASGVPARVTLAELLGRADAGGVAAGWDAADGRLVAPVGRSAEGPHLVDLVRDGPHVLVGGTTGSGKSQFLRTLVASLALSSPPDSVAFVLVDFKGGAAFGACADLPHVVGLVTDLDDHLVDRALTSLEAELRRRERLFFSVGAADLETYRRAPGRPEPLPRLVVVVDELKALVDEVPRFLDGLIRLAAMGRSLGVHLVLATQRPSGALTPSVQANVNLRLAFRVRDRADSVDVVDDEAAWAIAPSTPGRCVARGGDGRLVTFQAAVVDDSSASRAPFLDVVDARAAAPAAPNAGLPSTVSDGVDDAALRGLVDSVRSACTLSRRPLPRRPWLPPLPDHVDPVEPEGRSVRVGLVDEPELQRTSPLVWSATDGPWLICGGARSGRSTAARAVVLSAATRHSPDDLHVHVVDATHALGDLATLPHVGTVVRGGDRRALTALVGHLTLLVASRRAGGTVSSGATGLTTASTGRTPPRPSADDRPATLVVVDGWEQLLESSSPSWSDPAVDGLFTVLRDGTSVGVTAVVTGGRGLLQPRWSAVGGRTLLLGHLDPLDAALAGLRAADLPRDPPRGRGVLTRDRREVQVAAAGADVTSATALRWYEVARRSPPRRPWAFRPLPDVVVRPDSAPSRPLTGPTPGTAPSDGLALALAVGDAGWRPLVWRVADQGRRLLVVGPARSGRTTALATLAEAAIDAGRTVVLVSRARGGPGLRATAEPSSPGEHDPGGGRGRLCWVASDDTATFIHARRRWPDAVVLVDDADRLDEGPMTALLREASELLDRDRGLLVVASTLTSLATRFRGLDVDLARGRSALLLMPRPGDGDVVGVARLPDVPALPGRGVLVGDGRRPTEVQVYRPRGSGLLGLGSDVGDSVAAHRDQGRGQRQEDHAPPQDGQAPLHDRAADGEEQCAPHDGRRARPRSHPRPRTGQDAEGHPEEGDEHRRHDDADRVASLTDGELVEVEQGTAEERQGLHRGQRGGGAAGAA